MNSRDIVRERLRNQQLAAAAIADPAELVAWMGAVQAQDYAAATWALGLRTGAGGGASRDWCQAKMASSLRTSSTESTR